MDSYNVQYPLAVYIKIYIGEIYYLSTATNIYFYYA